MTTASCLYRGEVVHHRHQPVEHRFRYGVFMLYIDLDELPELFSGSLIWSASRPALAWFRRADHTGDPQVPLAQTVRDLVAEKTGRRPTGPVRLLTHPRYLGIGFNPISLYYCYSTPEGPLAAVVAEVTNTPWGERHCYVIDVGARELRDAQAAGGEFSKAMHVSPFLPMDLAYRWSLREPSSTLRVSLDCLREERTVLTAGLSLRREELSARALRRVLIQYPPMCAVVLGGIYWQALRLWRKGVPYHRHPHGCPGASLTPPAAGVRRAA